MNFRIVFCFLVLLFLAHCSEPEDQPYEDVLWYSEPALDWDHALPVGNGRMGAMVFGRPKKERIQLNEDSLWPGGPDWENALGTSEDIERIRHLLLQGKVHEADQMIVDKYSLKSVSRSHQTMGDLFIEFDYDSTLVNNYKRSLNLDKAMAMVDYAVGDMKVHQKIYCSAIDDVLVVELSTDQDKGLSYSLEFTRPKDGNLETVEISSPNPTELTMAGMVSQMDGKKFSKPFPIDYGVKFETRLKLHLDSGTATYENNKLHVSGARNAILYILSATSFYNSDYTSKNEETLNGIEQLDTETIRIRHIQDFQSLYHRVKFDLGNASSDTFSTAERVSRVKAREADVNLQAKLFNYGRYLLISCSRPGTNPANLQGLWNPHIRAPWNADYHLNINLQMNYWLAEVTNLSECHLPLFDFTEKIIERGRVTALEQYDARGAVAHHATDLWAVPVMRAARPYWGSWTESLGWLMNHYWAHFEFTQDINFLRSRAYPALKETALFYLDWLQENPKNGKWIAYPSTSPENSYIASDGESAALAMGTAMSQQIIYEVFKNVLYAAAYLEIEDDFVREVRLKLDNLESGLKIGPDGRLLEWNESLPEAEKGHRHMSHLYALHPGNDINENNPDFLEAARETIRYRLENGGAGPGWSRAWIINFFARLKDPVAIQENIDLFLQRSIFPNLFDTHPPFQIDGNFGYTAGIAEALIQSHMDYIELIPCLPLNWTKGEIQGLKARGNIEVSMVWSNSSMDRVTLKSEHNQTRRIRYRDIIKEVNLPAGEIIQLNGVLDIINH